MKCFRLTYKLKKMKKKKKKKNKLLIALDRMYPHNIFHISSKKKNIVGTHLKGLIEVF